MSKFAKADLSGLKYAPNDCVFHHVTKASRAVATAFDQAFANSGVTAHQLNIMFTLSNMGPMSSGALARAIGADASTVTRAVHPLVQDGLLRVESGPDRRTKILGLSAAGAKKLTAVAKRWDHVQGRMMKQLSEKTWRSLTGGLNSVHRAAIQSRA